MRLRHWTPSRRRVSLQVTSLLDMFTILLVFLLDALHVDDQGLVLEPTLELPASTARGEPAPAVHVALTSDAVLVEGVAVATLVGGRASPDALARGYVPGLPEAIAAAAATQPDDGRVLLVQADRRVPYATLDLLLRSAERQGFASIRLVVAQDLP